jgi:hypothetical protein
MLGELRQFAACRKYCASHHLSFGKCPKTALHSLASTRRPRIRYIIFSRHHGTIVPIRPQTSGSFSISICGFMNARAYQGYPAHDTGFFG